MKITVHPTLSFRDFLGNYDHMDVDVNSFPELFQYLKNEFPELYQAICLNDSILDSVLLFVNEKQIYKENLKDFKLEYGSKVMIVPSIAGG